MGRKLSWGAACALVVLLSAPQLAAAQEPGSPGAPTAEELEWKASWHRANWIDYASVAGGFGLYFADELFIPRRDEPLWTGPIFLDTLHRDALRARQNGDRDTASTISDVMLTGSLIQNMVFDNLFVALALHGEPDVAWQMTVANAQAYALTFSITGLTKSLVGRQRPYQQECEDDPGYSDRCDGATSYRSFFSGHSATTATGAGLLCAHHTHLPLYDGKVLDYGICGVGIALTLATGALRISSDKHWASDVMAGHAIGFLSGYLVPTLLYYTDDGEVADEVVLPRVTAESFGLQLLGRF